MSERATGQDTARARRERLDAAVATARRRFGPHVIRVGADLQTLTSLLTARPLASGSFGLDLIVGGVPRGKITEYAGMEGCGVEALALTALAACQRAGGLSVLVDADGSLDLDALAAFSINVEALLLVCPTTAVEAWTILTRLARSGAPDLLLVASLPSLVALPARGWAQRSDTTTAIWRRLSRLAGALHGRPSAVLLVNHPLPSYDDRSAPRDGLETVGGSGVAQHTTLRIALHSPRLSYAASGVPVHLSVQATVLKHHGLPHPPIVPLTIMPCGIRHASELVDLGMMAGCIVVTPGGLAYGEHLLGRSVERAAQTLERDAALATTLEAHLHAIWTGQSGQHRAERASG